MNTTVQALLDLYVKLGGALTDTYDDIADGEQVGNYTTIPDCIEAIKNVAGGGSDEPTFETLVEIPVGQMEVSEGLYTFHMFNVSDFPDLSGDIYFNSTDYPLSAQSEGYVYNFDGEEVLGEPAYAVGANGGTVFVVSTEDLSNTTVRILKKVEEPSGGKFVVNLTSSEEGGKTVLSADKTFDEIVSAYNNGQTIECCIDKLFIAPIVIVAKDDETGDIQGISFAITIAEGNSLSSFGGRVTDENEWEGEMSEITIPQVPYYSSADAGKVLTVDSNGELAWVTP